MMSWILPICDQSVQADEIEPVAKQYQNPEGQSVCPPGFLLSPARECAILVADKLIKNEVVSP